MVKRILFFFTREISGLHQAAYVLGFFTFLSQVLGLVRDRLLAYTFGADRMVDVYYAAFKIPDVILVLAGSLVSISVLVPFLTRKIQDSNIDASRFIDAIFTSFFAFVVVASIVLFFLMPELTKIVFPGINEIVARENLIRLARLFLLSPLLLGISNIFASVVQVHKRFLLYALSPLLYNLGIILGIVALYPVFGVTGLGLGVVIGAALHAGIQIPFIKARGFLPSFRWLKDMSEVWRVMRTSLPRTFTLSITKLVILFLVSLASLLPAGSIAIFNFAFNLQSVPMAIVGASYSLAAFPTLSKLFSENDISSYLMQITSALRHVFFWSLPVIVLFMVLRAHIVRVIFGAGDFGWVATRLTAAALALFVVSVIAQSVVLVLVRGFYAAGDTKTPLIANIIGGGLIISGAYIFMAMFQEASAFRFFLENLLRVQGVSGTSVLALPLAFSVGMVANAGLLWVLFARKFNSYSLGVRRAFFDTSAASIAGGFVAYAGLVFSAPLFSLATGVSVLLHGFVSGLFGIAGVILTLWLLENKEITEVYDAFMDRFWHVNFGAPEEV